MLKRFFVSVCYLTSFMFMITVAQAETTLRFAHFWPANSRIHTDIFVPWQEAVEQDSNGEIKIEFYPAQSLTKADRTYDATVKGITNIGATAQGYNNGRFPLTQIVELPNISTSGRHGSCILQTLFDQGLLAQEYSDSHVLFMFATSPGLIHTTNKLVKEPQDLVGMRIRRPTAVAGDLLESMGALPVGIPAPDIYTSLQRGVVDGLSFPWEAMKTFRINELTPYHTQMPFYTLVFVATMNKKDYQSLSSAQKAVIDQHSGMSWALRAGELFDSMDIEGIEEAKSLGHEIFVIEDPLTHKAWKEPLANGIENYLQRIGEESDSFYQAAIEISKQCAKMID